VLLPSTCKTAYFVIRSEEEHNSVIQLKPIECFLQVNSFQLCSEEQTLVKNMTIFNFFQTALIIVRALVSKSLLLQALGMRHKMIPIKSNSVTFWARTAVNCSGTF